VPGSYFVHARTLRPGGVPGLVDRWAVEQVDVVAAAVTGLTLRLQSALTLTGRVTFDGGSPILADVAPTRIVLQPEPDASQGGPTWAAPPPAAVRDDGTFLIEGVTPGRYQLEVTPPPGGPSPGWRVRSAIVEKRDLLDEPLVIDGASGLVSDIEIRLSDRHSSIVGTLQNLAAAPATSYVVVVLPADPRLRQSPRRVLTARPDTQGRFLFRSLPPGSYLLAVLEEDFEPAVLRASEFQEAIAARSVSVTLGDGEQRLQNLQVAR
jgi:hypothetical protein